MKELGKVAVLILLIGITISCKRMIGQNVSSEQKHNLEANINGLGNDTILVASMPVSMMGKMDGPVQDTIFSENGRFSYDIPSNEPILLYLFPMKGEFIRVSGRPYRPDEKYIVVLLRPNDKIDIQGELKDLYMDYQVKGSEFNEQYVQVRKGYIEATSEAVLLELELDTLMSNKGDKELINELFKKRNAISSAGRIAQLEYIENNLDKELSAFYLTRQPLDTFGKYYSDLTTDVRNGLFKDALESQFSEFKKYIKVQEAELKIIEGELAPDFKLNALSGDFSLNSVRGKYIVLDFWGSWCPPCIKGFPEMKEYFLKYQDRVEFVGIDCNEPEEKWRKAVQKYELPWTQVINNSDIEYDVAVKYGIKSFPTKFILDKDMKIIGKYIGETDDFYKKMDELMAAK